MTARRLVVRAVAALCTLSVIAAAGCGDQASLDSATTLRVATSLADDTATTGTPMTTQVPATTEQSTTATVASAPKFGDTVSAWGVEISVSAPELFEEATIALILDEGLEIQRVLVTIVNNSDVDLDYSMIYLKAQDNESFMYDPSLYVKDRGLDVSGTLVPGKTVKGYVGFEIPKGNTLASVTYEPMVYGSEPARLTWEQ